MSALEKQSVEPSPSRHLLRALPAGEPERKGAADPLESLIALGSRLLPGAVFILDHGNGCTQTWPPGMMGRRTPLDPLARRLMDQARSAREQWVASITEHADFQSIPGVRDAGPLAFACLRLGEPAGAYLAIVREAGEWGEQERGTVCHLAQAIAGECERLRLSRLRMEARSPGADELDPPELELAHRSQEPSAEQRASVAPLLSGVCHELNNPLTSIQSFAELLLLDSRSDDDREALEIVQREARRAVRIVGDLRMVARLSMEACARKELVDLNELVRDVLRVRGQELREEEIELVVELSPGLEPVRAVRSHLEHVISHLLSRALQALDGRDGLHGIEVGTIRIQGGVRFFVRDSGTGISADQLGRIDDRRQDGALREEIDLGTRLVQSIVVAHGGRVAARGRIERGSLVTVDLPTCDDIQIELLTSDHSPTPHGLRVLVVDDEAPIRFSLARYMERRGHAVDQAENGAVALRMVDAASLDRGYDIVIADLRMPALGGERLLERLREREDGLDQRLIFMTGDAQGPDVPAHLHDAGIPILLKPFELAEVAQVIEAQARLLVA